MSDYCQQECGIPTLMHSPCHNRSYSPSRSICRPLDHFDDLSIFLHFCRSSASLTRLVIPIPVQSMTLLMSLSQVLFGLPRLLAPSTILKHHMQTNPASWWYLLNIEVFSNEQLPEVAHTFQLGLSAMRL